MTELTPEDRQWLRVEIDRRMRIRTQSKEKNNRVWPREAIVAALCEFYATHQRWPITDDYRSANGLPSCAVVLRMFGSTIAAKEAAAVHLTNDGARSEPA